MFKSLKIKIWSLFTSITAVILLFIYIYFPKYQKTYLIENFNNEVQYIANSIALGVEVALSEENFEGVGKAMDYARNDERMSFVALLQVSDEDQAKTIFRIYPDSIDVDPNVVSNSNVIVKRANFESDVLTGEIVIGFSTNPINQNIASLKNTALLIAIFSLVVVTLVMYVVATNITRPLNKLKASALRVSEGDLTFDMKVKSDDEIGQLGKAFHHMVNELKMSNHNIEQQQLELEEKNQELLALNEDKNNLINIVAHDLKSPLNQIQGLIEVLKMDKKDLTIEHVDLLTKINDCSGSLSKMIHKILDVEAIESKQLNLSLERIDVINLLQNMCVNLHALSDKKKITMNMETKLDKAYSKVDEEYCRQAFQNLISNAIKFSPEGSNIVVEVRQDNDKYIIAVKDEGPGINDSDKALLFKKYQKLSNKPTGGEGSTGIGLSIVKKYVEMMGGEVWYQDNTPRGSSFCVSFKAA